MLLTARFDKLTLASPGPLTSTVAVPAAVADPTVTFETVTV